MRAARTLAESVKVDDGAPRSVRVYGDVTAIHQGDGSVTLDVEADDGEYLGVPMTTGCRGVAVGDRVVVDVFAHMPLVTGVIAHDNSDYVTSGRLWAGSTVLRTSSSNGAVLFRSPGNFDDTFGVPFDQSHDFVGMSNGDGGAVFNCIIGAEYAHYDGVWEIRARLSRDVGANQLVRVNWFVYIGPR